MLNYSNPSYDELGTKPCGEYEKFGHNDTVGCGIDFKEGHIFFTKNGRRLGNPLLSIETVP
jgi:hypothetical protein